MSKRYDPKANFNSFSEQTRSEMLRNIAYGIVGIVAGGLILMMYGWKILVIVAIISIGAKSS